MITTWQSPQADGKQVEEQLLSFDQARSTRILILPAWFDEANKLRRFTVELMRTLDAAGIDSFLPDFSGCNDSLVALPTQSLPQWRKAAETAAQLVSANHVLSIRAGALIAPTTLPGWRYAPQSGQKLLRSMVRARTLASLEAGHKETADHLMTEGRKAGLVLSGWPLSAQMLVQLEEAKPGESAVQREVAQSEIGGAGLWLRAEPAEDHSQVNALASLIKSESRLS